MASLLILSTCVLDLYLAGPVAIVDLTATLQAYDSHGTTPGGEYLAAPSGFDFTPRSLGQDPQGRFETYSVELNEPIELGRTYYVGFSGHARGSSIGSPNPDPLDPRSAYLYTQFISEQLDSFDFGTGLSRTQSANALQNTIWFLQGEIDNLHKDLVGNEVVLANLFLADANADGWTGIGNVRVMNLFENPNGSGSVQDQLVLIPAPGAAVLGVIGLAAVWCLRRRFG